MRNKDEFKQEAVFKATVKLVNEIGFVSSSVAKIAKEANVSPATIYIYYKNKEDLLVSTYIEIKKQLVSEMTKNINLNQPLRDILRQFWLNTFGFITKNRESFQYTEQFSNSPYSDLVNSVEIDKLFEPVYKVLQSGIDQKIIKNVQFDILAAFIFFPIIILSNKKLCKTINIDEQSIDQAFELAWDAIRY